MAERHQSSEWFVKDDSGVRGPISEAQLRAIVKQSSDPRLQVKKGNSEWHPAAVIRMRMKQLVASGIYVRCAGTAEGPFTISKAHELLQTVSTDGVEVRTGKTGKWISATAWLTEIRKLARKRQAKRHNEQPHAPVNHGPIPVTPIPRGIIVNDDAIVVEEDVVEAVVVDSVPHAPVHAAPVPHAPVPHAPVPHAPVPHAPVPHAPVHAAPVHAAPVPHAPVHAAPQPANPYVQTPPHVPQMPARPRSQARSSRSKGVAGSVFMKIGSIAISICLVVGFLSLKDLKLGGKQTLPQHQEEQRENQRVRSLYGPGRSSGGIASSPDDRSTIQTQLPSSPTGASTTKSSPIGSSPTARSNATSVSRDSPPIVRSGMLFRPQFVTSDGVVDAGTAFAAKIDGTPETLIISALHLFGPAGGLDRDIPAAVLSNRWQGLSLQDCKSQRNHSNVAMRPISLTLAKPLPDTSAHGDVVVCSVQDGNLGFQPFPLAHDRPQTDDRVWLVAEVSGSSSLVHEAKVEGIEDGWLLYRFERRLELRATSGAPIVNGSGQVVAVNAGGGEQAGVTFGVGTPTTSFVSSVASSF